MATIPKDEYLNMMSIIHMILFVTDFFELNAAINKRTSAEDW